MIQVESLSKAFQGQKVIDGASFTVPTGKVTGLIGPNGAGKTTILRMISGCAEMNSGSIRLSECDWYDRSKFPDKWSLGFLPDRPPLYDELTVGESIDFVLAIYRYCQPIAVRRAEVIALLHLEALSHAVVGTLSKGERQRVALAQLIAPKPAVILMDEPMDGLDPAQIKHFRELILELRGQHTILISSHLLSEMDSLCDHVVIVDGGTVKFQGSLEDLAIAKTRNIKKMTYAFDLINWTDQLNEPLRACVGIQDFRIDKHVQGHWHMEVDVERDDLVDQILTILVKKKAGIRSVIKHSHNLEDSFLAMTGE